ncbi:MAG TPA: TetR/AcrR family transcriptional regulator [Acidimicrobiales bacterium]|jgi:AcrR family transcriptional regulator
MVEMDATLGAETDPRVERSRRVILQAVLDELGRVGYGALSIEAVAARAGVGKSTIYRHWQGKAELVEDAFNTLKAPIVPPETGTLRERLVSVVDQIACLVQESTYSACIPALIDASERDPRMRAFHRAFSGERRAVLVGMLRDGVEAGELPASTDPGLLADALVGPIILRRLMLDEPIEPGIATKLVDQLLPVSPG